MFPVSGATTKSINGRPSPTRYTRKAVLFSVNSGHWAEQQTQRFSQELATKLSRARILHWISPAPRQSPSTRWKSGNISPIMPSQLRMPSRRDSMEWKSTAPTGISATSFCKTLATLVPMLGAGAWKTALALEWKWPRQWPPPWERTERGIASAPGADSKECAWKIQSPSLRTWLNTSTS